jgi:Protein of unknown function (DUF1553)/Protein of unknown function (DUF1549)/Bacterial Ig-like domain (group 2)
LPRRIRSIPLGGVLGAGFAVWLAAVLAVPLLHATSDDGALVILPDAIALRGQGARQQLLVERTSAGRFVGSVTDEATFSSSDPAVATVDSAGAVTAVANGRAVITAKSRAGTASTSIDVSGADAPYPVSFRNHVVPVLTRMGCNSGPCHGAAAGKNGFKLTLRGYDPELDYLTVTRQAGARRINRIDPGDSLLLLKPTLAVTHGGGRRFSPRSAHYKVIADWIAAGTPAPTAADPELTRLDIFPAEARLVPGDRQPLVVRAHFSDGHSEDVTRQARFTSSDGGVAGVDEWGTVIVSGRGEAAVSAWYLSRLVTMRVTSPFATPIDPAVFARAPRANFIDDLVLAKLADVNIPPSPLSSDSEFMRRAFLDAAGILPTPDEVRAFLADARPNKRAALVDALLERPEFIDHWAYKWSDLLLVSSRGLPSNAMWSYYNWIRGSVATNKPWNRMARELLTASGNTLANGAANYYVLHKSPVALTENVAMTFMGFSITCARCHNHPLEKWTQKDYYHLANLFARVGLKNAADRGDVIVYPARTGDVNHPRLNVPLEPKPLDGQAMPIDDARDRRAVFADWLVSPDNPFFARALVNRVWKQFLGRGLIEAVDDIRDANPASNQALFDALTRDFAGNGFDIKRLIRTIMTSTTYQLSSTPDKANAADLRFHSHYIARRLPAEVILDAISQVTGVAEDFPNYPGRRALQLPDASVDSYFLTAFGRPPRLTPADSERQQEPSVTQALHVINGDTINRKLSAKRGLIAELLAAGADNRTVIERIYLSALSRFPTETELRTLSASLDAAAATAPDPSARRQALEDFAWAVLTGREFLFTH